MESDLMTIDGRLFAITSLFEHICKVIKEYTFVSHYLLLKNQFKSLSLELFIVAVQTMQMLAFPFQPHMSDSWRPEELMRIVSRLLEYFHMVVFFENNTEAYFTFYYFFIVTIAFGAFCEWVLMKRMAHKGKLFHSMLSVLQMIIFFQATIFYIPILKLLLSIFHCRVSSIATEGKVGEAVYYHQYANTFQCWEGIHYMHISFGSFFLVLFLIKTLLFVSTYFEPNYNKDNPIGKHTASQDVLLKVIIFLFVIFTDFICPLISDCLIIILIMCILSLALVYYYFIFSPHYNLTLLHSHLCLRMLLAWSFICLLLGRLMISATSFDCNIALFLFGIPFVMLLEFSRDNNRLTHLIALSRKQTNGRDCLKIVEILLEQLDDFDSRSAQIILPGYAFFIEATCTLTECPLKKYIASMNNKKEASIFLLKHIETIYDSGISKYASYIPLRIGYCRFLIERMSKKQFAFNELTEISLLPQSYEEQFVVFRYRRLYEEYGFFRFEEYQTEVFNSNAFVRLTKKFQALIVRASQLYIDFWSLLFKNHNEKHQDLSLLNEIGTHIHVLVKEIEDVFIEANQVIHNEKDILMLYYDFVTEILHDPNKKKTLKIRIKELDEIASDNFAEQKLENFDAEKLSKTDVYLYMIINGQYGNLGRITNLSLSLCSYLGYSKEDLCGANIDDLIPATLRKEHGLMMKSKVDGYVKQGNEFTHTKLEYHDIVAFAINKSKYLIPFAFKQCYIRTENKEDYWLLKIVKDPRSSPAHKTCYVITDLNMNIQNFTGNSMLLLGLTSSAITNSIDISKSIKEFQEEYYKLLVEMKDRSPEVKCNKKRHLLLEKFKTPMIITWKRQEAQLTTGSSNSYRYDNLGDVTMKKVTGTPLGTPSPPKEFFFLYVTKLTLLDQSCGFLFSFDQVQDLLDPLSPNLTYKKSLPVTIESLPPLRENSTTQGQVKIDKSFLPALESEINFDPTKASYAIKRKSSLVNKRNDVIEYLKNEAMNVLRLKTNKKTMKASEESNSSSILSSCDNDVIGDSNGNSFESSASTNKPQWKLAINDNPLTESNSNNYYKVSIAKIRYSIFNYKEKAFIDQSPLVISQVEALMNEFNKHEYQGSRTEEEPNDLQLANDSLKESTVVPAPFNEYSSILHSRKNSKNSSLNKQIEAALSNEESQESIIKLGWISVVIILVVLINHSIFLGISLNCIQKVKYSIRQIEYAYTFIHVSLLSSFHAKELLYLQVYSYNNFYQPKADYLLNNTMELSNLFVELSSRIDYLSLNAIKLSPDNYNRLYNSLIQVYFIENETEVFSYQLTLLSSFSKLAASLFEITQLLPEEITPFQTDVFFFTRNIINYPFMSLLNQSQIYQDELTLTIDSNKVTVILAFGVCNFILLLMYFLIEKSLDRVIKRKESYLEVFFEIGSKVILSSLHKCYSFVQKTQNSLNQLSEDSVEASAIAEEYESFNENSEQDSQLDKVKSFKEKRESKAKPSKESTFLKMRIMLALCVTALLASITLIIFIEDEDSYSTYINVYVVENKMKNNLLLGFNTIREYLFNSSTPVLGSDLSSRIDYLYNQHICTIEQLDNEMKLYQSEYSKDYFQLHVMLHQQSLCNYTMNFFDTFYPNDQMHNCDHLLSGAFKYGISIVLSTFFDELNDLKNYYLFYLRYGETPQEIGAEELVIPMTDLINKKMLELIVITRFMILPIYSQLAQNVVNEIEAFSIQQETIIIALEVCFMLVAIIWFLFRWRIYLMSLSQIIFKTKNMLTIIPIEVLASLSSIDKVLKIQKVPASHIKDLNHFSM